MGFFDNFFKKKSSGEVAKGDKFGWLFTDNYFDMLPGQRKKVKVLGNKEYGTLYVKSQYGCCRKIVTVQTS